MALTHSTVNPIRHRKSKKIVIQRKRRRLTLNRKRKSVTKKNLVQKSIMNGSNNNCPIETNPFQLGDGPNGTSYQTYSNMNSSNKASELNLIHQARRRRRRRRSGSRSRSRRRPQNSYAKAARSRRRRK